MSPSSARLPSTPQPRIANRATVCDRGDAEAGEADAQLGPYRSVNPAAADEDRIVGGDLGRQGRRLNTVTRMSTTGERNNLNGRVADFL
jgi:hypothetical protein